MSVPLLGTCPDMCPEKERYRRESEKDFHQFECYAGTKVFNHRKAVKAFPRHLDAAPLTHELRPSPTLELTINYLIRFVLPAANINHGNLLSWYSFFENRLRAIKKDAVQQQLQDAVAIRVLEKCSRFFIHAGYFMQSVPHFNNVENSTRITDFLMHLRQTYGAVGDIEDLRKNEDEFTAYFFAHFYDLTRFDTHVKMLEHTPHRIQNSPIIKSMINITDLLVSGRHAEFFDVVEKLPYLLSCIIQRYFDAARIRYLQNLLDISKRDGKLNLTVTLNRIQRDLGFKSAEGNVCCVDFIRSVGGIIDYPRSNVAVFESIQLPANPLKLREQTLLEASLGNQTIFELINGEEIDYAVDFGTRIPHTSFDSAGNFVSARPPGGVNNGNVWNPPLDPNFSSIVECLAEPTKITTHRGHRRGYGQNMALGEIRVTVQNIEAVNDPRTVPVYKLRRIDFGSSNQGSTDSVGLESSSASTSQFSDFQSNSVDQESPLSPNDFEPSSSQRQNIQSPPDTPNRGHESTNVLSPVEGLYLPTEKSINQLEVLQPQQNEGADMNCSLADQNQTTAIITEVATFPNSRPTVRPFRMPPASPPRMNDNNASSQIANDEVQNNNAEPVTCNDKQVAIIPTKSIVLSSNPGKTKHVWRLMPKVNDDQMKSDSDENDSDDNDSSESYYQSDSSMDEDDVQYIKKKIEKGRKLTKDEWQLVTKSIIQTLNEPDGSSIAAIISLGIKTFGLNPSKLEQRFELVLKDGIKNGVFKQPFMHGKGVGRFQIVKQTKKPKNTKQPKSSLTTVATMEKKYICQHCGATFGSYKAKYRHEKTHSEDNYFRCEQCPYKTFRRDAYSRHLASHRTLE